MSKEKQLGVIVISYNSAATVIETLNSIKEQTRTDIELVISDDGSKDNTVELVEKWAEDNRAYFKRLKIVKNQINKGIPANCNQGLKAANADLVKFIAADDVMSRNAVEIFAENYGDNSIVQSKVELFGSVEENPSVVRYCERSYKILKSNKGGIKELLKQNYIIAPAIGFLNREKLLKMDGFDERFPEFEDYPMWIKMADNGFTFRLLDERLIKYRLRKKTEKNISGLEKAVYRYYLLEKKKMLLKYHMYIALFQEASMQYHVKIGMRYGINSYWYKMSRAMLLLNSRAIHDKLKEWRIKKK